MSAVLETISHFAASALISSIWQGLVLAAMLWVCLRFVPRTTASIRFMVWSAMFLAIALLPVLSVATRHSAANSAPGHAQSGAPALLLDSRWALAITALWATITLLRLSLLARNALGLRTLFRRSIPVAATPAVRSLLGSAQLGVSSEVDQPCVIGFLKPRVLIPDWLLEKATAAEVEQIVLHEVSHLRRFDDWTNLVQKLVLAFFPLNPALYWVEGRLCAEREIACDERVIRSTKAPREYATCLTNLAEQRMARRALALSGALSLGAWERRSQLAGRVESILRGSVEPGPLKAGALTLGLVLGTLGGAIELGHSTQVVGFASASGRRAFSQASSDRVSGPNYSDVVYRPESTSFKAEPAVARLPVTTAKPKILNTRPALQHSPHRGGSQAVKSLILVTRWQAPSGEQVTVIDRFVRISALSAAQSQGGWFLFQL